VLISLVYLWVILTVLKKIVGVLPRNQFHSSKLIRILYRIESTRPNSTFLKTTLSSGCDFFKNLQNTIFSMWNSNKYYEISHQTLIFNSTRKFISRLIKFPLLLWPPTHHISSSLIHFNLIVITASFSMISSSCVYLVYMSKYAKCVEWRKNREKRIHNKKHLFLMREIWKEVEMNEHGRFSKI